MLLFSWFAGRPRKTAQGLISEARALVKDGRIEEAIHVYRKIRRRDLTAEILVEIGRTNLRTNDLFGAAECAARALELDPIHAPALCIQGEIQCRDRNVSVSLELFRKALDLDPASDWARNRIDELTKSSAVRHKIFNPNEDLPVRDPGLRLRDKASASRALAEMLQSVAALKERGAFKKALVLAQRMVEFARLNLGEDDPNFATTLVNLGYIHEEMGNYASAEPLVRQAMEVYRSSLGEGHPHFATALNNLAQLFEKTGRYEEAEPLMQRALQIRCSALGKDHPDVAISLSNLAALYYTTGNYAAAEPLSQQALEIRRTTVGVDHPDFAISLNNLAELYKSMGRNDETEALLQQALEIRRAALGQEHPVIASSLNNLATFYMSMGRYAKAEPLLQQAMRISHAALGEGHPQSATVLGNLAQVCHELGRYEEAESLLQRALKIRRATLDKDHPGVATILGNLASLYCAMGKFAEAEPLSRQALEIRRTALGVDHPDCGASMGNLATLHMRLGKYADAESLLQQMLEMCRCHMGDDHLDFAIGLHNVATLYAELGRYAEAEALLRQVLEISCAALGEDHPHHAASMTSMAQVYLAMGRYDEAEPLLQQSLEIHRAVLGEGHPSFATSLNNLAALYKKTGDYTAAERLCGQALEISRAALGENHPDFASGLNNLGELYISMGNYVAAAPLCRQALEIRRAGLGKDHADVAISLRSLAGLFHKTGNYAVAEPLYRQATKILHVALGKDHPDVATSLNNLASLYEAMGDYAAAEPLYRQATKIQGAALGEDHPDFATCLNNLACFYKETGDHAAAESLCRRALEILRAALREDHPDVATSLNNLASLYEAMGDYAAAEPLYHQATKIRATTLGEDHPEFATSLNNLAGLYKSMDRHDEAEPLLKQSLEILRAALGNDHPDCATILQNLAGLHHDMGDYAAAEPLFRQALDIARVALGEEHLHFALSLSNLASLYAARGRAVQALELMSQAAVIENRTVGQVFSIGSERQRMAYLQTLHGWLNSFLSLVLRHLPKDLPAVRSALNLLLQRKGIGLEALAVQRDQVVSGQYPELSSLMSRLTMLRSQIGAKQLAGPGKEGREEHTRRLHELEAERESLEKGLASQIPEMDLKCQLQKADWQAVALALPSGSALVEFVRFNEYDFKAVRSRGERSWKGLRYLAFVLSSGEPYAVEMIDLGEAEPIDRLIAVFRAELVQSGGRGTSPANVTGNSMSTFKKAAAALRARVLPEQLLEVIGNRRRLFLSPDGELNLIPFEVLPSKEGHLLLDEYEISYLGTGRDVLRFGQQMGTTTEAVVVADPDFALCLKEEDKGLDEAAEVLRGSRRSRSLDLRQQRLFPLPMTRMEGEAVVGRLTHEGIPVTELWVGAEALDGRVKTLQAPRILHIATHGIFLEEQEQRRKRDVLGMGFQSTRSGADVFSGPVPENPLLRSMLALTGANAFAAGYPTVPEAEDGLLTAEDVCGMNLWGTELVALPDCDTGLGEVRRGEGVFGLRRAVIQAGARTLVMSLWKVPDLATAVLIDRFYENLLKPCMTKPAALHKAQGYVRDVTVGDLRGRWLTQEVIAHAPTPQGKAELRNLARQADDHRPFEHVRNWGAFICQGDPAPMGRAAP